MYKELATIKDKDRVTGFLVYDGTSVLFMDVERMKKEAAEGYIDTLAWRNGQFVPIIQGDLEKELKQKFLLGRYKKLLKNMTFDDFVDTDCIFRQQDLNKTTTDNGLVLANIGNMLEFKTPNGTYTLMVTLAFYSPDHNAMERIRKQLSSYGNIKNPREYGTFMLLNVPLYDPKHYFDLLMLQQGAEVNFLYNLEALKTLEKRADFLLQSMPGLFRKIMSKAKPTEKGMNLLLNNMEIINNISRRNIEQKEVKES